jgi:3-methylfumaryl-CoA hydratase
MSEIRKWIGRSEEARDVAEPGPIRRLAALLDHEALPRVPGGMAPLGHWLYFLPEARESDLGPDGHPARGGFLPPVALPRRMWAGGRVDFLSPIPLGAEMTRRSTIIDIVDKSGSSRPMTFVVVRHEISLQGRLAVREEQDIVYRGASGQGAPAAADGAFGFCRALRLSPLRRAGTGRTVSLFGAYVQRAPHPL